MRQHREQQVTAKRQRRRQQTQPVQQAEAVTLHHRPRCHPPGRRPLRPPFRKTQEQGQREPAGQDPRTRLHPAGLRPRQDPQHEAARDHQHVQDHHPFPPRRIAQVQHQVGRRHHRHRRRQEHQQRHGPGRQQRRQQRRPPRTHAALGQRAMPLDRMMPVVITVEKVVENINAARKQAERQGRPQRRPQRRRIAPGLREKHARQTDRVLGPLPRPHQGQPFGRPSAGDRRSGLAHRGGINWIEFGKLANHEKTRMDPKS